MKNFNEICAYAAGIMDGEGHFGITIQRPTPNNRRKYTFYCAKVTVVNTDIKMLQFLASHFKGTPYARKKIKGRKQIYYWSIFSKNMEFFCKSILPYLICKKEQAEILLDYFKNVDYPKFNISPEEKEKRERLYLKLKSFNKVGDKE